jgi:hypothetical protein
MNTVTLLSKCIAVINEPCNSINEKVRAEHDKNKIVAIKLLLPIIKEQYIKR